MFLIHTHLNVIYAYYAGVQDWLQLQQQRYLKLYILVIHNLIENSLVKQRILIISKLNFYLKRIRFQGIRK